MKIDTRVMDGLDQLKDMLENAPTVMFSQKRTIDVEDALSILDMIREEIPEEFKQVQWINIERTQIMSDAKREAREIVEQAQIDAARLKHEYEERLQSINETSKDIVDQFVMESEPMALAEQRASEVNIQADMIIENAQKTAEEIKEGSIFYAEEMLCEVEELLTNMLREIEINKGTLKR
ncbi:MAG: hypothetical protein R3Y64_05990 [Peptostreptococcaceae bacterium]